MQERFPFASTTSNRTSILGEISTHSDVASRVFLWNITVTIGEVSGPQLRVTVHTLTSHQEARQGAVATPCYKSNRFRGDNLGEIGTWPTSKRLRLEVGDGWTEGIFSSRTCSPSYSNLGLPQPRNRRENTRPAVSNCSFDQLAHRCRQIGLESRCHCGSMSFR